MSFQALPISNLSAIKQLLPHREPMIMVDSLLQCDAIYAKVGFTICPSSIFIEDNSLSETGLIEHMAQAAALQMGYQNHSPNQPAKEGFIASIKRLNIHILPKVDATLITEVHISHQILHMTTVKLITTSNSEEIASAEMNMVIREAADN